MTAAVTSLYKVEPGKMDCYGNVTWFRVYHKDNYWNFEIVHGTEQQAYNRADLLTIQHY